MSQEGAPAAGETPAAGATERQCLLLACFAGSKRAAKIHRELNKRIDQGGDALLGEVVVKVDSKHKVQVHDPRRVVAGTLTPALTWGIFGLLAGGVKGLAIWAVVGAICGGLYAYYSEHLLTKDELKRIGGRLPVDSSAIVAFVRAADPRRLLSSAASSEPTTVSVAEITPDLSAQVHNGDTHPEEASATQDAALEMLMVRYTGEHAAKKALAESGSEKHKDKKEPEVELFVEANEHGRLRVIEPKTGTAAFSKSQILGWGLFGVAYGLIVGFAAGNNGVLGAIESGVLVGVLWGIFGAVAGALYGMWAGRGVSARRLKGLGAFVPPDSSLALAWAEGSLSQETIERWAATSSRRLLLRFNPVGRGALLEV